MRVLVLELISRYVFLGLQTSNFIELVKFFNGEVRQIHLSRAGSHPSSVISYEARVQFWRVTQWHVKADIINI